MKIFVFGLIFILLGASGCTEFFESTKTSENNVETKTKQQKAQEAIEQNILNSFGKYGTYKGYKYGELFILKPKEIVELDQLFELKKLLPTLKENYPNNLDSVISANDTAIAVKKREIKTKNIYHTYELRHVFKIKTETGIIKLYECKFILYPNYKVKDVNVLLNAELSKSEDEWFYYFIMQYPLFELENNTTANRLNEAAYSKFNTALENENENKAELLKTILVIIKYIRQNNNFNETDITKLLASKWMKENTTFSKSYKSISYSELEPISSVQINPEKDTVIIPMGYNLNHKFEFKSDNDSTVFKMYSFEFDLNFLIQNVFEKPFTDEK